MLKALGLFYVLSIVSIEACSGPSGLQDGASVDEIAKFEAALNSLQKAMDTEAYKKAFSEIQAGNASDVEKQVLNAFSVGGVAQQIVSKVYANSDMSNARAAFLKTYPTPAAYFKAKSISMAPITTDDLIAAAHAGDNLLHGTRGPALSELEAGRIYYVSTVIGAAVVANAKNHISLALMNPPSSNPEMQAPGSASGVDQNGYRYEQIWGGGYQVTAGVSRDSTGQAHGYVSCSDGTGTHTQQLGAQAHVSTGNDCGALRADVWATNPDTGGHPLGQVTGPRGQTNQVTTNQDPPMGGSGKTHQQN